MEPLYCTNCGAALLEGSCFCSQCGTAVTAPEAPPAQEPETEPQPPMDASPVPAPKRAPGAPRGIPRTLLAILLCVVMFLLSFPAYVVTGARQATSQESLQRLLEDALDRLDELTVRGNDTVMDLILDFAKDNRMDMTEEDIEDLLEDTTFAPFLCERLSGLVTDIRQNTKTSAISRDDFQELMEENADDIDRILNIRMAEKDILETVDAIDDSGMLDYSNARELRKLMPAVSYGVQYGLSAGGIAVLWILVLVCLVLLALVNRWDLLRTAFDAGVTLTVFGGLTLVLTALSPILTGMAAQAIPAGGVISLVLTHLMKHWLVISLMMLAVGILLLVIRAVVRRLRASRAPSLQSV